MTIFALPQELLYSSRPSLPSEYYKTVSTKVLSPHPAHYSTAITRADPGLYTKEDDEQVAMAYDRWLASIKNGYFIPSTPDTLKDQHRNHYSMLSLQRPPSPPTDFDIFINQSNSMESSNGILSSEELDSIFESFDVAMMGFPERNSNVSDEDEIATFSLDDDAFGRIAMI